MDFLVCFITSINWAHLHKYGARNDFFYICKLLVLLNVNYYIKGYIYYFITNSILDKYCHN